MSNRLREATLATGRYIIKMESVGLHLLKISDEHRMFPAWGPKKVRDFLGRGGGAATSTSLASSLSQATDDEAKAIDYGVL